MIERPVRAVAGAAARHRRPLLTAAAATAATLGIGTARRARALAVHSGVSEADRARALPGDDLIPDAAVVMDRLLRLPAPPSVVWPWLAQLGKQRAGWYLPRWLEWLVPPRRRGARAILPDFQHLAVGDDVPDWGPGDPVFRVAVLDPPRALVYLSLRDRKAGFGWPDEGRRGPGVLALSWALVLDPAPGGSRLHIRLRLEKIGGRAPGLLATAGGLADWATIALLERGLRERLPAPGR